MATFPLFGVHEVMTLGPEKNERGKPLSRLGYFDNLEAALYAVERVGDFKGAYIGLNPIVLDSGEINPVSLRVQSNRARAGDVLHRVRLFLDFDPERPTDTNSTDEEKAGAYAQALEVREYLRGFGWPDPMLCDSGNGWHLLYRIQLPNDAEARSLIGEILAHLKSRYSMLDTTAGDANRFCKLYGTMTRKGPDSAERPWRRARIVDAGSGSVVPEAGLRAILPPRETKPADNAQAEKLLEFLAFYDVATRSDVQDVARGFQIEIECPWQGEHTSGETTNDTTVSVLDGKYGFNCLHGHCKDRHWAEFRAELEARTGKCFSFVDAGPTVTFGSGNASVTFDSDAFEAPAEDTARPVYPDDEWKGTAYGDFADYCADGNFIPKRFFSEALRTIVGAVVGGQLSTDYQGVNPRSDTVLIGPPGSGKGTAITAARQFVECEFDSQRRSSERPLLWDDAHDPLNWCWPSRLIGAHVVSPASAPGLIEATKPHKLEKGESRNPLELWRELPRFITIQEEIGGLFANFANENSGRGLETAILELYDRESFTTTATNGRAAKSGRLLYSVLGGIPKKEWERIFARSSSVGSGLFSRLNIIGTENERTVAGLPEYDFGEMQRVFLPRITALERTPARIPLSPNGRALLNEWFIRLSAELKELEVPSARLNIHALRVALHLAWLRGHANILESDVDSGIKVANFQAKMREFYLPAEGDNPDAQLQARIMQGMKAKRSLPYRELQRLASASRAGVIAWERAIAGLVRDGRIAIVKEVTKAGQKRKVVKLLKGKD